MNQTLAERPISSGKRVVVPFRNVKRRLTPPLLQPSVLQPAFETDETVLVSLWLKRMSYRRRLSHMFGSEPDSVLEDFGLTRASLRGFVAKPFWCR